ncbi:unnamed protein product [Coffea canephora]|uniref:ABC-2 type transporter transmembrane domain-containing protein n=1 Tax=Coffea canephora TaxID=49390 RepID=A0A068V222_COFCA|nr:unnamed protein product [Coffea canephora]
MHCPGALHLFETNAKKIRYGICGGANPPKPRVSSNMDHLLAFLTQMRLQTASDAIRCKTFPMFLKRKTRQWFQGLPPRSIRSFSQLARLFPVLFYLLVAMFGFTFRIHSLVLEKEPKLRQTMSIMGLYDSAYWTSWFIWEGFMAFLTSLLIVVFGTMFRDDIFVKNNIFLVFLLFFLFMISMVSFAFMISTLLSKSSSATTVGFFILAFGIVTVAMKNSNYRILCSFFPPNPFARGFTVLEEATGEVLFHYLLFLILILCILAFSDQITLFIIQAYFYLWLVSLFFFWSLVAIYFDNIHPNSAGLRKSRLYFLKPNYWTGRGDSNLTGKTDIRHLASRSPTQPNHFTPDDEDVREEDASVKKATIEGTVDLDVAVQLRGLTKSYSVALKISCHCWRKEDFGPDYCTLDLWMNFPKNQLFCLLGPNRAGKSILISCLTGISLVTHRDGKDFAFCFLLATLIYGNSIRNSKGMSTIRTLIGVCTQVTF